MSAMYFMRSSWGVVYPIAGTTNGTRRNGHLAATRSGRASGRRRREALDLSGEPGGYGRADRGCAAQRVVPGDRDDLAAAAGRRHAERVAFPLDDERGHLDGVELVQARLLGLARRVDRKGQAEDRPGPDVLGRPARHARASGTAAGEDGQLVAEVLDDRDPGSVELAGRRRGAPAGNPIGLLDEGDAHRGLVGRVSGGDQVGRRDPAPGAVAEHEQGGRVVDTVQVDTGRTMRRLDLHRAMRTSQGA